MKLGEDQREVRGVGAAQRTTGILTTSWPLESWTGSENRLTGSQDQVKVILHGISVQETQACAVHV